MKKSNKTMNEKIGSENLPKTKCNSIRLKRFNDKSIETVLNELNNRSY